MSGPCWVVCQELTQGHLTFLPGLPPLLPSVLSPATTAVSALGPGAPEGLLAQLRALGIKG